MTSLTRSKKSYFKNRWQSFALSNLDFLFHSNVNIYTKIRIAGAIGGPMVQTLPLLKVPFQYLSNNNFATASYVLFSHRQPSGTKLPTTGKRHYATVAQRTCNGFLIVTFLGGFYKNHCGQKCTTAYSMVQFASGQLDWNR